MSQNMASAIYNDLNLPDSVIFLDGNYTFLEICSECSSQPEPAPAPAPITSVECQDDNNPNNRCTIIHRECSDLSNSIISAFS